MGRMRGGGSTPSIRGRARNISCPMSALLDVWYSAHRAGIGWKGMGFRVLRLTQLKNNSMAPVGQARRAMRFSRLALVAAALGQFARLLRVVDYERIDFRVYYGAVVDRASTHFYDYRFRIDGLGFTYPPAAALLLRPLTSINELLAERTFFTVSLALTVVFTAVCVRLLPQRPAGSATVPVY